MAVLERFAERAVPREHRQSHPGRPLLLARQTILLERERIKRQTIANRRLQPLVALLAAASACTMLAIDAREIVAFDRAYDYATRRANEYHVLNGKSYIRWKRPDRAPDDLDLGSG